MSMKMLNNMNGAACDCGKSHVFAAKLITGKGVLSQIPGEVRRLGGTKVFLLSDANTWEAAGKQVYALLQEAGIPCTGYSFPSKALEPDEEAVGSAIMHYDPSCDLLLCTGSGVLNDIAKMLKMVTRHPYIIVGTAPSMDGYASASSSLDRDGLKVSLASADADVIIGDADILCNAPLKMMKAGLGDMLAKYVSICEWRIANLITGEYYCEQVAQLTRSALKRCVDNAEKLLQRDEEAVMAVFEGLVISGVAMNYAGVSRPASGLEHYISHCLDMRGAAFGTPTDFHGIQCAIGTLVAARLYEKVLQLRPDKQKALAYGAAFDYEAWSSQLRTLLGKGAESMIALEAKEGKYDLQKHAKRLEVILAKWDAILDIIREEMPTAARIESILDAIDAPKTLSQVGTDEAMLPVIVKATKDIRDKYVLSRLLWDLGELDDIL